MPVHPAAPTDVPTLIDAYRRVAGSFADICAGLRAEEWRLPTSCPGWTVREHLAHATHVAHVLAGEEHPEVAGIEVGSPEHVRNDFGVWNEQGVRSLADRSPEELLADFVEVVQVRSASMYSPGLTPETLVPGPMGSSLPFGPATLARLADLWVHEQDVREAVGRPGSLDTEGASAFLTMIESALPETVLGVAEAGTVVIVECTGPATARMGVRVGEGAAVAHPLFTGQVEEVEAGAEPHAAGATTTITLSTDALTRRAAGRRSVADTAYAVSGDEALAAAVLERLVLTP